MYDFILNGQAHGSTAQMLMELGGDANVQRPYLGPDGRTYLALPKQDIKGRLQFNEKRQIIREAVPTVNAEGVLFYDEWKQIDQTVIKAPQPTMKAWGDLRAANSLTIPQGLGKTVLESRMMGDITPAEIAMDPVSISSQDRPRSDLTGIPLPVIFKDWDMTLRELMVSRNSQMPLDTTMAELSARKVGEEVEKLTIGVGLGYKFDGYSLYGYANHPKRLTVELYNPEDSGWSPKSLLRNFITIRQTLADAGFNGPHKVYLGRGWDTYLDLDYSDDKGDNTLRERIMAMTSWSSMQTLDFLPEFDIVVVQLTSDVARAIVASEMQTIQWSTEGGMKLHFKTFCCMVPQIRADFYDGCGVCHGAVGSLGS